MALSQIGRVGCVGVLNFLLSKFSFWHRELVARWRLIKLIKRELYQVCKAVFFALLVVLIALLYFGVFQNSNSNSDNSNGNSMIEVITLVVTCYMAREVVLMQRISNLEISDTVFDRDKKERDKKLDAIQAIQWLNLQIQHGKSFDEAYYSQDEIMNPFRQYAFHYEYIGQLVYREDLDFNLVFDTVTFPDAVFAPVFDSQDESTLDIEYLRNEKAKLPDLWNGIEYLYRIYLLKRADNRVRLLRRQGVDSYTLTPEIDNLQKRKDQWKEIFLRMPN